MLLGAIKVLVLLHYACLYKSKTNTFKSICMSCFYTSKRSVIVRVLFHQPDSQILMPFLGHFYGCLIACALILDYSISNKLT